MEKGERPARSETSRRGHTDCADKSGRSVDETSKNLLRISMILHSEKPKSSLTDLSTVFIGDHVKPFVEERLLPALKSVCAVASEVFPPAERNLGGRKKLHVGLADERYYKRHEESISNPLVASVGQMGRLQDNAQRGLRRVAEMRIAVRSMGDDLI
jgi:hypothetical protein